MQFKTTSVFEFHQYLLSESSAPLGKNNRKRISFFKGKLRKSFIELVPPVGSSAAQMITPFLENYADFHMEQALSHSRLDGVEKDKQTLRFRAQAPSTNVSYLSIKGFTSV
jgi:hypothetical protein